MIYGQAITFGGASAPKIFGDGSDGVGNITASTTWNAPTADTGMIVKNFESLTIASGVTVSAGNRNCGMIIRVKGDCTIAGTLANKLCPKIILNSDGVDFSVYPRSMLNGVAGDGGAGGSPSGLTTGTYARSAPMKGRFYGGGFGSGGWGGNAAYPGSQYGVAYGGGGDTFDLTTAVADSAMFVGGTSSSNASYGGGGCGCSYWGMGVGGNGAGGAGGTSTGGSRNGSGGGGCGNYGGGVIILLVGGNLTITGTIDCSGSKGGAGGTNGDKTSDFPGHGGGGGGGGRIFICHKGTISNTGTLNVNGGSGGAKGALTSSSSPICKPTAGNAGTAGTVDIKTFDRYKEEDAA